LSKKDFDNLLAGLFSAKGIVFKKFKIYIWNIEENICESVEAFHDLEKLNNFSAIFCLSNVKTSINDTPFNFEKLDFSCRCENGKCCDFCLDPDVFTFNSEDNSTINLMRKMNDDMIKRLTAIAQALFILKSSDSILITLLRGLKATRFRLCVRCLASSAG